jgi:hypothetical protein
VAGSSRGEDRLSGLTAQRRHDPIHGNQWQGVSREGAVTKEQLNLRDAVKARLSKGG